ncbi:MAG: indole-3-glycerol phosphate synthase TrpC [Bacteroidota bacterium]|nr:indole-3-glycerol phosphate synthase TrpC [Bacteroidota bacterium]
MNILENIMVHKRKEVAIRRTLTSEKELLNYPYSQSEIPSFTASILNPERSGIIAEYKRESPSKGTINQSSSLVEVIPAYDEAGASAISVLTDSRFFGGNIYDLVRARKLTNIPLLRKDFVFDEYQILEARCSGASAILLIAAVLSKEEINRLAAFARSLDLEVLCEVHSEEELEKVSDHVNAVGVNNRDLKTFNVSFERSLELAELIPDRFVKVSESGINDPKAIETLRKAGFRGFLIGEYFMKGDNPGQRCRDFISKLSKNR